MKKIIYLIIFVLASVSCSNNDKEVAGLVRDKIDTMSGHEVVRDLLIENDGDEEQLARIFKCSVPTINRIKNKETYLTDNALEEFKNLLVAVKVSGKDTFKENDPYYDSIIRSYSLWVKNHVIYLIISFVILLIIIILGKEGSFNALNPFAIFYLGIRGVAPYKMILLYTILFFVAIGFAFVYNLISPYSQPEYIFIEKINPIIETLL